MPAALDHKATLEPELLLDCADEIDTRLRNKETIKALLDCRRIILERQRATVMMLKHKRNWDDYRNREISCRTEDHVN